MKYILTLENDIQKSHLEMSNAGKELKNSDIEPFVISDENSLKKGIVYVSSPFQKDKYFRLDEFVEKSQEKWLELLQSLSAKMGAKIIEITTIGLSKDKTTQETAKNKDISGSAEYKLIDGEANYNSSVKSKEENNKYELLSINRTLSFQGNKNSKEEIDEWIKQEKIDLENNPIFKLLYDEFKNNNLRGFNETKKLEQLISGTSEICDKFGVLAKINTPLFSCGLNAKFEKNSKKDYESYKSSMLRINILFDDN